MHCGCQLREPCLDVLPFDKKDELLRVYEYSLLESQKYVFFNGKKIDLL